MSWFINHWPGTTNGRHSLSFAFAQQLPQRGSRGRLYHSTYRPETAGLRAIFIAPTKLKNRFPLPFNGRHSLSLAFARQLPQGGSRERAGAVQRTARKPEGYGRFSSPLRNSKTVSFYHSSGDTPSVSFADSSLREGAGNGLYHSTCRPESARLRAIFIAPTEL